MLNIQGVNEISALNLTSNVTRREQQYFLIIFFSKSSSF